jgi:hypothetical protein
MKPWFLSGYSDKKDLIVSTTISKSYFKINNLCFRILFILPRSDPAYPVISFINRIGRIASRQDKKNEKNLARNRYFSNNVHQKALWILLSLFFFFSLFADIQSCEQRNLVDLFIPSNFLNNYNLFVSADYRTYKTDHFWNKNGKKRPTFNRFEEEEISLFLAYNISCSDILTARGFYDMVHEEINGKIFDFADSEASWIHYFHQGGTLQLATELLVIIPSGGEVPNVRYGRFGIEGSLLCLKDFSIYSHEAFSLLKLGYRAYQGFPSDQIRGEALVGYQLFSQLQVSASAKLDYGLFNGKREHPYNTILFNANYRLLTGQIDALYEPFEGITLTLSYYEYLWGQNNGAGGGWIYRISCNF